MDNKAMGRFIRQLREERALTQTQLGKLLGCSRQNISYYESGRHRPSYETFEALSDVLNVPIDFFLTDEEKRQAAQKRYEEYTNILENTNTAIRVPVFGQIPAGIPMEAIEDVIDYEEIPAQWAKGGKEYFALKIKGDSMSPKFIDGDTVIFKKQDWCESGQDCAVMVNSNEATFKRVRYDGNGIALIPLNPDYDITSYNKMQIEELPVRILGIVAELRRKF